MVDRLFLVTRDLQLNVLLIMTYEFDVIVMYMTSWDLSLHNGDVFTQRQRLNL